MKKLLLSALLFSGLMASAETYDLTKLTQKYTQENGYGYDLTDSQNPNAKQQSPFYFSAKVADGNYRVTVTVGSKKRAAETIVRAENRRMLWGKVVTKKGELKTISFIVNKRDIFYTTTDAKGEKIESKVRIKPSEVGSLSWDEKLSLEFNGANPAVQSITIEPEQNAVTVYLCGNSTVVDQGKEPWASWGQMFPYWFAGTTVADAEGKPQSVAICNLAESGLTASSFYAQNRLEYILAMMKPGDYVFCEFGHNDEKEKGPGTGAWYHYSVNLKKYIDLVRQKEGNIIFCTPTQRRFFEKDGTLRNTHGDFPAAMKAVAERENVPLIDLNASTKTLFETMGSEGSKRLLVHYELGSFPWQQKKFEDNTHFNPFGAYEVSKLIVMGLKQLNSPLVKYLRSDWQDFNPSQPDDYKQFYWPNAIFFDGKKPDGN